MPARVISSTSSARLGGVFRYSTTCGSIPVLRIMASALREVPHRSEEHTSELQSLMRISYAVFCLKKKKQNTHENYDHQHLHTDNMNNQHLTTQTRHTQEQSQKHPPAPK